MAMADGVELIGDCKSKFCVFKFGKKIESIGALQRAGLCCSGSMLPGDGCKPLGMYVIYTIVADNGSANAD